MSWHDYLQNSRWWLILGSLNETVIAENFFLVDCVKGMYDDEHERISGVAGFKRDGKKTNILMNYKGKEILVTHNQKYCRGIRHMEEEEVEEEHLRI